MATRAAAAAAAAAELAPYQFDDSAPAPLRTLALGALRERVAALRRATPALGGHPLLRATLRWGVARAAYVAVVERERQLQQLLPPRAPPPSPPPAVAAAAPGGK